MCISWEADFVKESGLDETKHSLKTLVELGFPGEHEYSNPLAFYFQDDSVAQMTRIGICTKVVVKNTTCSIETGVPADF